MILPMPGGQVIILPDDGMSGAPTWALAAFVIVTFLSTIGTLVIAGLVFFDIEGGPFEEWIVRHMKLLVYAAVPLAFFGMFVYMAWTTQPTAEQKFGCKFSEVTPSGECP